ncbi:hypothetical protein RPMA_05040 [Tardiphaga alba]|uniref:Abortive phage infection protein C-terminal domain-containing protein n=1 Tax=Tardiphaga alba TaxID=340268 RepID=A0ABX8A441_9BRAD|nr:AIPR family protein [Tardiphaga alba]QUS38277.1 hypothetical protein RPMA_05040 [Tardiphaga alba]
METKDLEYGNLKQLIASYEAKGRSESPAFLNWFLENVYRLDDVAAADAICDEQNDKGIDGIYIDHNEQQIHLFQSKIRQKANGTVGDVSLKNLAGSLTQFQKPESIDALMQGDLNTLLKRLIAKTDLRGLVEVGYEVFGIFVTNELLDQAALDYLKINKSIVVYDRQRIASETIDIDKEGGIAGRFTFDVSYVSPLEYQVGTEAKAYIVPISALQLVKLQGISDGVLFSQNVRFSLGGTPVNKAIATSVQNKAEHKYFPLFHNGIILLCADAQLKEQALTIENYVVVNGAQSLSTLYKNQSSISSDLRMLVKVIALRDSPLAQKITLNSNNQNAIKPRDLRSNNDIMLRLKKEFEQSKENYYFEIKRGENLPSGTTIIANDLAGRMLLAFDLHEPYSCHQLYRIFDDEYADIFGRREVDCYRIIFLRKILDLVEASLPGIKNVPFANYGLTRYFLLHVISVIVDEANKDRAIVANPKKFWGSKEMIAFYGKVDELLKGLIVDLNYEVAEVGESFDYKADLKSPKSVEEWTGKLVRDYQKDVQRGKAVAFD